MAEKSPVTGGSAAFSAQGDGLTFITEPFAEDAEITGPAAARLFVSSTTTDADLFLTLRVSAPTGEDITFVSGLDPAGVIGMGWLRASQRAIDPERSLPHRPWHPHDRAEPLTPGEIVVLDVEIWPTSVLVPASYRVAVTLQGRDFEFPGDGPWPSVYGVKLRGHGLFVHTDPANRPAAVYGGTTTLFSVLTSNPICCCRSFRAQPPAGLRRCVDRSRVNDELDVGTMW